MRMCWKASGVWSEGQEVGRASRMDTTRLSQVPSSQSDGPDPAFGFDAAGDDWLDLARRSVRPLDPSGVLGTYTIVREIGRGGQGVVYEAVQPGTGRRVALKRLGVGAMFGSRARDRFSREVAALTRLSHRNIIHMLGAEIIDDHPVLVMELVEGEAIDRAADKAWSASGMAAIPAVLELFVQACAGVAHAHSRAVIHRDIKPSNVLVDAAGVARVLDFGIAKLLDGDTPAVTATGFVGTLAYAAPEQLERGAVPDTAGDIYALGAVLYRLLSGRDAIGPEVAPAELVDRARRGEFPPIVSVRSGLPPDAESIVRCAMSPDPAQRYPTVEALAADVLRLLADKPVSAHAPSALYRLRKFYRRHTLGTTLGLSLAGAIIVLSIISTMQAARLTAQRDRLIAAAETEHSLRDAAELAQRLVAESARGHQDTAKFLMEMLRNAVRPEFARPEDLQRKLAVWAGNRIDNGALAATPEAEVSVRVILGQMLRNAGDVNRARQHLLAAIAQTAALHGENSPEFEYLRQEISTVIVDEKETAAIFADALARAENASPAERAFLLNRLSDLAGSIQADPRGAEVSAALLRSLELSAANPQGSYGKVVQSLYDAAWLHLREGEYEQGRAILARALELFDASGGIDPVSHADLVMHNGYAALYSLADEDGVMHYRRAVDLFTRLRGPDDSKTIGCQARLAVCLQRLGRHEDAIPPLRLRLADLTRRHGAGTRVIAQQRFRIGAALLAMGRDEEAHRELMLAISRGKIGTPSESVDPPVAEAQLRTVRDALRGCEYRIAASPCLIKGLGDQGWLLDLTPRNISPPNDDERKALTD